MMLEDKGTSGISETVIWSRPRRFNCETSTNCRYSTVLKQVQRVNATTQYAVMLLCYHAKKIQLGHSRAILSTNPSVLHDCTSLWVDAPTAKVPIRYTWMPNHSRRAASQSPTHTQI